MIVNKYVMGPFRTNTYLLEEDNECIIIDPASKAEKLIEIIGDKNLLAILITHGHLDHIKAVDGLVSRYNCPVYINKDDEEIAKDKKQGQIFGMDNSPYISVSCKHLKEGKMKIEPFEFEVIFTPGHSKGSTCFKFKDEIFTGDTLFNMSVGRTDLYTGNEQELRKSLKVLSEIKENLKVYPGHEEITTLDFEKQNNPYLH